MKIRILLVIAASLLSSCQQLPVEEKRQASISFSLTGNFAEETYPELQSGIPFPDTNRFNLSILTSKGRVVYDGLYGSRPKDITIDYGTYTISLLSSTNMRPAFNNPQYGEIKRVVVDENLDSSVVFNCLQLNSGVKFTFKESFRKQFPLGKIKLREVKPSGVKETPGELDYSYSESRYAYFQPGKIEVLYTKPQGEDTLLLSRTLVKRQMLTLNLSYSPLNKNISAFTKIGLDTARYWNNKDCNLGIYLPEGTMSVPEAKEMIGEKSVMVFGYIVGTDATENSIRVGPPFASDTYIIISDQRSPDNRRNCMAVELPSKSDLRRDLNLVTNPNIVGAAVILTGDIVESYQSLGAGLKNTKSYSLLE